MPSPVRCSAVNGIRMQLDGLQHLRRRRRAAREALHQEATLPAVPRGQLLPEPAELRGEGVVDEQDVHDRLPPASASPLNCSARRGRQASWLYLAWTRAAAASPSGRCAAGSSRTARACCAIAPASSASSSRPVSAVRDDLPVRLGVGGHHDAAGGHGLERGPRDRISTARGDVQVAGGQDLGHRLRRSRAQEPEAPGVHRRPLRHQVRRVILVVEGDVEPPANDRIAHHHDQGVGPGPEHGVGRRQESVEPPEPVERSRDEADRPASNRGSTGRRSSAALVRWRAGSTGRIVACRPRRAGPSSRRDTRPGRARAASRWASSRSPPAPGPAARSPPSTDASGSRPRASRARPRRPGHSRGRDK